MEAEPKLPIPISLITERYLLFDNKAVSYLRREQNICGVLIGTLPQSPNQNIFLGLPVELMPEEARLLVSKGIAVIVDDVRAHDEMLHKIDIEQRASYLSDVKKDGHRASRAQSDRKDQMRQEALKKVAGKSKVPTGEAAPVSEASESGDMPEDGNPPADIEDEGSLFSTTESASTTSLKADAQIFGITPFTSKQLLPYPPTAFSSREIDVPSSYPLFSHLHKKGFFMSPGLRFGCQYMAYPGDPLRYHSHFLVVGREWDKEFDLMDIVGGGRLGTGVKKGYLIGAADPNCQVRTFSVEWAGM